MRSRRIVLRHANGGREALSQTHRVPLRRQRPPRLWRRAWRFPWRGVRSPLPPPSWSRGAPVSSKRRLLPAQELARSPMPILSPVLRPRDARRGRPSQGSTLDRPLIMGIVNVTPDSFSDGGLYDTTEGAIVHAAELAAAGADIVDVGGESTRPGSDAVEEGDELCRVSCPCSKGLRDCMPPSPSIRGRQAWRGRRPRLASRSSTTCRR